MVDDRAAWVTAAERHVTPERLADATAAMVDIASPTGEERALAVHLAAEMSRVGLDGRVQPIDDSMANAHGRLAGTGDRPSLLLYAPIDTVTAGREDEDIPWAGPALRADMRAEATVADGLVVGLGAHNPKGHGACVLVAAEALAAAEIPLAGDLLVGFGAGGMPSNRRRPDLADGHGAGCAALVHHLAPDRAVIAKTGWAVSWEEVGLTWFEVLVEGTHTYVGSRHLLPYRNAIADAGRVIAGLEAWFPQWAEEHRDGLVAPQGVVAAIEGGWPRMPAFTTSACRFWVDLRLSPRTTPAEAADAFGAEVDRLGRQTGATVHWEQTVAIPGSTTSTDDEVIQAAIGAWESLEGRPHEPITGLSGATDANILRGLGVPTARVGLPKVGPDLLDLDFQLGMNAVAVADLERLTRLLIRTAVELCGAEP